MISTLPFLAFRLLTHHSRIRARSFLLCVTLRLRAILITQTMSFPSTQALKWTLVPCLYLGFISKRWPILGTVYLPQVPAHLFLMSPAQDWNWPLISGIPVWPTPNSGDLVCFVSFSSGSWWKSFAWMATSKNAFLRVLSTYSLTISSVWLGENDAWEGHWTKNTDCVIRALLSLLHSHNSFGLSFLLCQSVFPQTLSWNMALKHEGRGRGTAFKRMTWLKDMTESD